MKKLKEFAEKHKIVVNWELIGLVTMASFALATVNAAITPPTTPSVGFVYDLQEDSHDLIDAPAEDPPVLSARERWLDNSPEMLDFIEKTGFTVDPEFPGDPFPLGYFAFGGTLEQWATLPPEQARQLLLDAQAQEAELTNIWRENGWMEPERQRLQEYLAQLPEEADERELARRERLMGWIESDSHLGYSIVAPDGMEIDERFNIFDLDGERHVHNPMSSARLNFLAELDELVLLQENAVYVTDSELEAGCDL
ncbi:MAG: hypothetical protein FWE31_01060 [Firmicutes bacterium]|nr:hypothetical protein [Bacillota bacterium]